MARSLRAIGRDHQTDFARGPVGLVYAHAVRTPQARGERQPVEGGDGRFIMLFDGRLDNRRDLIQRLGLELPASDRLPDSQLAMYCWERWRTRLTAHLVGDFALIVWDERDQRLFAARDHFGLRPLCYHATRDRIVIASTPFAVLAAGGIERRPDARKLADVLVENYKDHSRSFYENIRRLPPAHCLVADRCTFAVERYWSLEPQRRIRLGSDQEYVEAAKEILNSAVTARLRANGTVGAQLSGGLDTSAVAVTALRHLGSQAGLPTFTLVAEGSTGDDLSPSMMGNEAASVHAIAGMYPGIQPYFIPYERIPTDHGLDDRFTHMPMVPRSALTSSLADAMHREAGARGVEVLLDGTPGNLTLSWSAHGAFGEWLCRGQFGQFLREVRLTECGPLALATRYLGSALPSPSLPWSHGGVARWRRALGPNRSAWQQFSLINPDFARKMEIAARAGRSSWLDIDPRWSFRRARLEMLTASALQEIGEASVGLEALHGVESRFPLLDVRLVEWCLAIPEAQYLRNGQKRWLAKRMMAGALPEAVLQHRRLGLPVADWHRHMSRDLARLHEHIEILARDHDVALVLDVQQLRRLVEHWPVTAPDARSPLSFLLQVSLPQAMSIGHFVRHVKGANL